MEEQSKRGICNRNGIRIYPVPQHGKYYLEIEYNKSPGWEKRYVTKCTRGKTGYDPRKEVWKEKIEELYQELFQIKVKPILKRKQHEHESSQ